MNVPLLERWRRRLLGVSRAPGSAAQAPDASVPAVEAEHVTIDPVAMLSADFAAEFPVADAAAKRVLAATADADLAPLARRSPALLGYDWTSYLRCSVSRVVRVQRALTEQAPPGGRVLDFGSYFGNFSLACRAMGFEVDAIDAYDEYGSALAPCVALQRESGVSVYDFATVGHDLAALGRSVYDAVICAGVIEHIPHTPRQLLDTLTAVLKPGGVLVLDTPNLGYLYKRLTLLDGGTIFAPIAQQYYTELPFEGHHREYTVAEVDWMLRAAGLEILSIETFNHSVFGQSVLTGDHVAYHRHMEMDPASREIIIAVSRRPHDA